MKLQNLIHILIAIVCIGLLPQTQAVVPPPGDFYPGGNTASGQNALLSRTTGNFNTAVGIFSVLSLTDGNFCTGVGAGTLLANTAGENTATGAAALLSNTIGDQNTATGGFALFNNIDGSFNTANGDRALFNNTTGGGNTALGSFAGESITGSGNVCIGAFVSGLAGENDTIRIGNLPTGAGDSACYIGGIAGQTVGGGGTACFVANDGKLGVLLSGRRFKTDIADMGAASEAVLALRPVIFRYKPELDKMGIPQFGLVAEEVEAVNPDLVVRDKEGKVTTVRYEAINAMLLNEFLKEHKKVEDQNRKIEEQEATIAELKKEVQTVVACIKEQAAKIQKVSAQVDLNRHAPRTVVNNP